MEKNKSKNKKIFISILIFILLLAIITIIVLKCSLISKSDAKNIAYEDANISKSSVDYVTIDFDFEDGAFIYEIDFIADNIEYEYLIKASTGAILKKETEILNSNAKDTDSSQISLNEAKNIALADSVLSQEDVTFLKDVLTYEDNIQVYDLEFYTDEYEYEYEVNALTGEIVYKSHEKITTDDYIQVDEAKNIAVDYVNFSLDEVTFTEIDLDNEDGIMVYEIQFYKDNVEYEFTINATTGSVIKYEKDKN